MTKSMIALYISLGVITAGMIIPGTIWAASDKNNSNEIVVEQAKLNLTDDVRLEYLVDETLKTNGITFTYNDTTIPLDELKEINYDFSKAGTRKVEFVKEEGNVKYVASMSVKVYHVKKFQILDYTVKKNTEGEYDTSNVKIKATLNETPKSFNIINKNYPNEVLLNTDQYTINFEPTSLNGKFDCKIFSGNASTSFTYYDDALFNSKRVLKLENNAGTSEKLTLFMEESTNGFLFPNNSRDIVNKGTYVYEDGDGKITHYPFVYYFTGGTWASNFSDNDPSGTIYNRTDGSDFKATINGVTFSSIEQKWHDAIIGTDTESELSTDEPDVDPIRVLTLHNYSSNGKVVKLFVQSNTKNFVFPDGTEEEGVQVSGKYIITNSDNSKLAYPFKFNFLYWNSSFISNETDKRVTDAKIDEELIIDDTDFNQGFKVNFLDDPVTYYATGDEWRPAILGEVEEEPIHFIPNVTINDTFTLVKESNTVYADLKLLYSEDGEDYSDTLTDSEIDEIVSSKKLQLRMPEEDPIDITSLEYNSSYELIARFNINAIEGYEFSGGDELYQKIHPSKDRSIQLYYDNAPYDKMGGKIVNPTADLTITSNDNYSYQTAIDDTNGIYIKVKQLNDVIRFDHMGTIFWESYRELDGSICEGAGDFKQRFVQEDGRLYLVLVGWVPTRESLLTDLDISHLSLTIGDPDEGWDEDPNIEGFTTTIISQYEDSSNPNTPYSALTGDYGGYRYFLKFDISDITLHTGPFNEHGRRMVLKYMDVVVNINDSNNFIIPTANGTDIVETYGGKTFTFNGNYGWNHPFVIQ